MSKEAMATRAVTGIFLLLLSTLAITGCDSPSTADIKATANPPKIEAVAQQDSILVKDANGQPVEGAAVKPWAVRSSMGHGLWNGDYTKGTKPEETITDANGVATVTYPKYRNAEEQVAVTAVTVSIDHPDHPRISHEDVTVPPDSQDPHVATLPRGTAIEVTVKQDGKPVNDKNLQMVVTGNRTDYGGTGIAINDDGTIRVPPLKEGAGQLLLFRLDEEQVTHFSAIEPFDVVASTEPLKLDVQFLPALPIRGKLSDNVPRPVKNGRVKLQTIGDGKSIDGVEWFDWAPVEPDGSFVIEAWPQNTPAQVIALCDGFIAANGKAPEMVPPERASGAGPRAQVFMDPQASEIIVEMVSMVRCRFECRNAFDEPLKDIEVFSGPKNSRGRFGENQMPKAWSSSIYQQGMRGFTP